MESINLAEIRAKLSNKVGRDYWERLDEVAQDPTVKAFLDAENKNGPTGPSVTRRQLLKYMAASFALAGVNACTKQPVEKIFPYSNPPENLIPGKPLYYASMLTRQGVARGVLVETHMGRPTKVDGNPAHPDGNGTSDVFMQAEILNLYDPDRLNTVLREGKVSTWNDFVTALRGRLDANGDSGLHILTETVTSPSLYAMIRSVLAKYPQAKWHQYESAGRDAARAGALASLGRPAEAIYHFDKAERIFSLDADFLEGMPGSLHYAKDYVSGRQKEGDQRNRLYVVEPTPSNTGAMADHRFTIRASGIEEVADQLAKLLGVPGAAPTGVTPPWLEAAARDLMAHRGRAVVVPGEYQSARVHVLAHAMNRVLGAVGQTVEFIDSIEAEPIDQASSLRELHKALIEGQVSTLIVLGGNPVFAAPADLNFSDALKKAAFRVYLATHRDETARLAHWAVPGAHELETWGDARAFDGTVSLQQPMIAPLYDGKSPLEVLSVIADPAARSAFDIVKEYWAKQGISTDKWERSLHDGLLPDTAFSPRPLTPRDPGSRSTTAVGELEIVFRPDSTIWDGRHANNGWLQELPKPMSTLVWDNVAQISAADAKRWGASNGDVLELDSNGRKVKAPAWITAGQAAGSVTVTLGYGRTHAGRVGTGIGFDAQALRSSDALWTAPVSVSRTRRSHTLVTTQNHHKLEGRDKIIRIKDLSKGGTDKAHGAHGVVPVVAAHGEAHAAPAEAHGHAANTFDPTAGHGAGHGMAGLPSQKNHGQPNLLPKMPASPDYAWSMTIDLDSCLGCNACTIACQSENNIPIVGKKEVARGREMHWIRIDRYQEGSEENPEFLHQPIACQHCENAPCEIVCPVEATSHSMEGLNEMTYNRCVGTRYCSNNCPYKVRRYNFFQYADLKTETFKMQRNPDVTVRVRGVMEKCTYCVQRINVARITAEREGRKIKDGEIVVACQQACATGAISFGNILDKNSEVSKKRQDPRAYGLLTELNTNPRTSFLMRVRNRNPEILDV